MAGEGKLTFKVNVLGMEQLNVQFRGRLAALGDCSPAFARIAATIFDAERQAFAEQGAYEGNPAWAPLSPRYEAWKAKHYAGKGVLDRTGRLRAMMEGGPGVLRDITAHRMELRFGLRVGSYDLGGLHQTGTRRMPARKPLLLSRIKKSEFRHILAAHINQETKR